MIKRRSVLKLMAAPALDSFPRRIDAAPVGNRPSCASLLQDAPEGP